ncbi:SRPBCC domain-containing protein [Ancylobacter sp. 6x-1]|uniref:SRPBCC domain-containing protein n=1 Tax=Ancylobacter crimeensis TaxID=2579147 RepID=A0ABT0DAE3_9HYPH|nr:SRPBCC domain-containing protein [Ancylobacter crimeensis]MCK0196757.1 SRPBCC domain-containing protein [Ancylobacter crimeensis]
MRIEVECRIEAPIDAIWRAFNDPADIVRWDASEDWRVIEASNDLQVGGQLRLRMAAGAVAADGDAESELVALYTRIEPGRLIEWRMGDGRHVSVAFLATGATTLLQQSFDAEEGIAPEVQRQDWQTVLDRFAGYVTARSGA